MSYKFDPENPFATEKAKPEMVVNTDKSKGLKIEHFFSTPGIHPFEQLDWEARLQAYAEEHGEVHRVTGTDYFVFSRGLWQGVPPFALGRTVWDNWLIYRARSLGAPVVDATSCIMAVHQNHDYAHLPAREAEAWKGPEAKRNLEMAGGYDHVFTLEDATHTLMPSGPRLDLSLPRLQRHLDTLPNLFPQLRPVIRLITILGNLSGPLRTKLGLTLNPRRSDHHEV